MNDNNRTGVFLGIALVAIVFAWAPWNARPVDGAKTEIGGKLFPLFEDPLAATSLQVTDYDQDTSSLDSFQVKQQDGAWRIPSHNDYPADAREHLASAATSLNEVKIINVESTRPADQEKYGVVSPDPAKLKPGAVGVGRRVTFADAKGSPLADLVIGKEVKNSPDQFYVRPTGRNQIYRVGLKTKDLSTKFGDWIEKDLLKINPMDMRTVEINDYSTELVASRRGGIGVSRDMRSQIKLSYDDQKANWKLDKLVEFDAKEKPTEVTLTADEELNTDKLNDMKTALDDLKIVDVERKPKGLSGDLRVTPDFVNNEEALASLAERGFIPVGGKDSGVEILSTEGEVRCGIKDGVEYVLRFGGLTGKGDAAADKSKDAKAAAKDASDPDKEKAAGSNRYLFVMARFDENAIPKPALEEVPEEPAPAESAATAAEAPAEMPASPADAQKKAPAAPATGPKPAVGKTPAASKAADAAPAGKPDPAADNKPAAAAAGNKPAADPAADAAKAAELKARREAIEKENKRKQDDYDKQVKKGQASAKELNDRFADWYYVISDDTFRKIHLTRADIIKAKKKEAGKGDSVGDLHDLEHAVPAE